MIEVEFEHTITSGRYAGYVVSVEATVRVSHDPADGSELTDLVIRLANGQDVTNEVDSRTIIVLGDLACLRAWEKATEPQED